MTPIPDQPTPLKEDPYVIGEINKIEAEENTINRILVVGTSPREKEHEPALIWFRLNEEITELLQQHSDDSLTETDITEIEVDLQVKGWEKGWVKTSNPAQGAAKRIVITEEQ